MADYAIRILSNPPLFRAFSEAARQRAASHCSYRDIIPQYEAIYERVLNTPS